MENKIKTNNCILQDICIQVKTIKEDINDLKNHLSIIKRELQKKDIDDEVFTTDEPKPPPPSGSGWFFS